MTQQEFRGLIALAKEHPGDTREWDLRCLTVWQPWASLIVYGDKDIENRPKKPPSALIGRLIGIHAGMQRDGSCRVAVPEGMPTPNGMLLGVVRIVGTVTESDSRWFCGPVGIQLAERQTFPEPMRMQGKQGYWRPSLSPNERALMRRTAAQLVDQGMAEDLAHWMAFYTVKRGQQ